MCLRGLILRFDAFLRRRLHITDLCDDPECLLRVRVKTGHQTVALPGFTVPAGAPLLELHLWNEHILPIPETGADMVWALRTQRMFLRSLREAARQLERRPEYAGVQAVTGITVLVHAADGSARDMILGRLGFTILPCRNPLGRFGEFWENLYTYAIMWAYNAPSVQRRNVLRMRRSEFWMPAEEFRRRFGG